MIADLARIATLVRPGAPLADSPIHGEEHWQTVCRIAARLAAATPGCDAQIVALFGVLHDCRRLNESYDPDHGPRAAELARELIDRGDLVLDHARAEILVHAIDKHADGTVTAQPTVGVCWDADRLCLPRVGIGVDPTFLSTTAATGTTRCATEIQRDAILPWAALEF